MAPQVGYKDQLSPLEPDEILDTLDLTPVVTEPPKPEKDRPPVQIVWRNVVLMAAFHIAGIYGLCLIPYAKLATVVWGKGSCSFFVQASKPEYLIENLLKKKTFVFDSQRLRYSNIPLELCPFIWRRKYPNYTVKIEKQTCKFIHS